MASANSASKAIRPIDRGAVHRICSGQVVLDLATAVKELVENSLDAGATNIEIRLKEYGSELIEVADNGSGVSSENFQALTLKYHTSKISDFSDLQTLSSFGFRGEALSSLCALADVTITTRTKNEPVATRIEYDHGGKIVSTSTAARAVGTTVAVAKLFSPLPVRYKELQRNVKREYGRLATLLQAYAVIATGVRMVCTNQTGRSGRTTVVQTQGSRSLKDNIVTVFGTKTAACLEAVDVTLPDGCRVNGFVSKPGAGCGRASGDRQFFYINGRPVDLPKAGKLINEVYKAFNSMQFPMTILNFGLPTDSYDVNLTPDKRKVLVHSEPALLGSLKEALESVYAPNQYVYSVQKVDRGPIPGGNGDRGLKRGGAMEAEGPFGKKARVGRSVVEEGEESEEGQVETGGTDPMVAEKLDFADERQDGMEDLRNGQPAFGHGDATTADRGEPREEGRDAREHQQARAELGKDRCQAETSSPFLDDSTQPVGAEEGVGKDEATTLPAGSLDQGVDSDTPPEASRWVVHELECKEVKPDSNGSDETKENVLHSPTKTPPLRVPPKPPVDLSEFSLGAGQGTAARLSGVGLGPNEKAGPGQALKGKPDMAGMDKAGGGKKQASLLGFVIKGGKGDREGLDGAKQGQGEDPAVPRDLYAGRLDWELEQEAVEMADEDGRAAASEEMQTDELTDPKRRGLLSPLRDRSGLDESRGSPTDPDADPEAGIPASTANQKLGAPETPARGAEGMEGGTPGTPVTGSKEGEDEVGPAGESADKRRGEVEDVANGKARRTKELVVHFDMARLRRLRTEGLLPSEFQPEARGRERGDVKRRRRHFSAATLDTEGASRGGSEKDAALAAATQELERTFNKGDFRRMKVVGQFNLGFIIARLDDDLFILDQHASDEKYNFERLTKSLVLNRQPLLRPLPLELSASEEITVLSHMETFRKNGFDFVEVPDAQSGQRLRLSAVPFSKNITFGVADVHELISLLADEPIPYRAPSGPEPGSEPAANGAADHPASDLGDPCCCVSHADEDHSVHASCPKTGSGTPRPKLYGMPEGILGFQEGLGSPAERDTQGGGGSQAGPQTQAGAGSPAGLGTQLPSDSQGAFGSQSEAGSQNGNGTQTGARSGKRGSGSGGFGGPTVSVRPSRVRAMLASRACRSSVMIGMALSASQMDKILIHLADLDAPWNCPHGRPTMRHLADLASIKR